MTEVSSTPATGAGRIVVGVDGSSSGNAALQWAARQAELTATALDAVITWTIPASAAVAGALPDDFDPAADAKQALAESVAAVRSDHPSVEVREIVLDGPPGPSLVDYAQGAELLVVGSRGHGFLAGLLLGSVSEYVVSHAHCPVLVLRHADPK